MYKQQLYFSDLIAMHARRQETGTFAWQHTGLTPQILATPAVQGMTCARTGYTPQQKRTCQHAHMCRAWSKFFHQLRYRGIALGLLNHWAKSAATRVGSKFKMLFTTKFPFIFLALDSQNTHPQNTRTSTASACVQVDRRAQDKLEISS